MYLFVGLVCVVGPRLLLIAAVTGVERALFLHSAVTAEGALIALRETTSAGRTSKSSFPIFQFKAANGKSYTVTSNIAERATSWRLGGPVRVLIPAGPSRERSYRFLCAAVGMLQVVVGVIGAAFPTIPSCLIRRFRSDG